MKKQSKLLLSRYGITEDRIKQCIDKSIGSICDPAIADAVKSLRKHKIDTFASCDGDEGHSFNSPIVRIDKKHTLNQITKALTTEGYCGFFIKPYYECLSRKQTKYSIQFWEVEFFVSKPKRGIYLPSADRYYQIEVSNLKNKLYESTHLLDTICKDII